MPAPLVLAAGSTLIGLVDPFVRRLLNLIPDPSARAAAEAEWAATSLALIERSDERQVEVNKIEAASNSIFQGGWRPAAAWMCVFGLFMQTIAYPLIGWGLSIWAPGIPLPQIDTDLLTFTLTGLLGLGGFRTVEKMGRRA